MHSTSHLLSVLMPAHAAVSSAAASATSAPPQTDAPILAKYIIIARGCSEYPIIFSKDLQHSEMVPAHAGTPVSAGFYQFLAADLILDGGESQTLKLRARPQDADIIKQHLLSMP